MNKKTGCSARSEIVKHLWSRSQVRSGAQHLWATGEVCLQERLWCKNLVKKSAEKYEDTVEFKSERREERSVLPGRKFRLSGRSRGCYSPQPETLTSSRDCQWIQIPLSPLSIVAPTFSLDKFDNNVASVIGQRGKEQSDWLASFFNCVHLSSSSKYQVLRI